MLQVATHNGTFHADEVTAIALLNVFTDEEYDIVRTRDQAIIASSNIAIDVGGEYDEVNRFDHHQESYTGPLSSAGMIWQWLAKLGYPVISTLVSQIDEQDTGVKFQEQFHYCNIISSFNASDIHGEDQAQAFNDAVAFATRFISNLKGKEDLRQHQTKIAHSARFQVQEGVMFAIVSEWVPVSNLVGLADFMVSYDKAQSAWAVQQVPIELGKFGGKYKLVARDTDPELEFEIFVHKAGFIGKYKEQDCDTVKYLTVLVDGVGICQLVLS